LGKLENNQCRKKYCGAFFDEKLADVKEEYCEYHREPKAKGFNPHIEESGVQ